MRSAAELGWLLLALAAAGCGGGDGKPDEDGVSDGSDGGADGGADGASDGGADGGSGDGGDTGAAPCPGGESWQTVGAPFIYTWCTPCHGAAVPAEDRQGAPAAPPLDSHAEVQAAAERVRARALRGDGGPMPPAGGPTESELLALEAWLDCGAP